MLGDNAYENGTDSEYQTAVFNMYPTTLRQSVLWPTIGNHDTAQSSNPPASLPYFAMFTLPANAEAGGMASGTERYYSFDYLRSFRDWTHGKLAESRSGLFDATVDHRLLAPSSV
jgi:hypothetical protein